jgi:hypothetical protein
MKTVIIVAPHFLPSFLAAVHRARLLAYHLPEFGWKPIILTTDPVHYECQLDKELVDLLPEDLEVIKAGAFPIKPVRIVGDVGLRSLPWYYQAVRKLAAEQQIDFLYITIPSNMAALLGPRVERTLGIPYGIDYIDPWVPETPTGARLLSKLWLAETLAHFLEPIAVRRARLITGINDAYFASVLSRNPKLRQRAVTASMPYGGSERDFEALIRKPRKTFLFDPADGKLHLIYAGALLPKGIGVLDRLLAALALLRERNPQLAARLQVHFVGTGTFEGDPTRGHGVQPHIERYGLEGMATEMPSRIKYLDVLNHLEQCFAILVVGSTEVHYSPSKIFQAVMARRPVFALLHEESTAVATLRESQAGEVFTFTQSCLPDVAALSESLERFLTTYRYDPEQVHRATFDNMNARESSRILATALDRAVALSNGQCLDLDGRREARGGSEFTAELSSRAKEVKAQ